MAKMLPYTCGQYPSKPEWILAVETFCSVFGFLLLLGCVGSAVAVHTNGINWTPFGICIGLLVLIVLIMAWVDDAYVPYDFDRFKMDYSYEERYKIYLKAENNRVKLTKKELNDYEQVVTCYALDHGTLLDDEDDVITKEEKESKMDIELKHYLNVIEYLLGRYPEELTKHMPADDIIGLGINILDISFPALDELYDKVRKFNAERGGTTPDDAFENIDIKVDDLVKSMELGDNLPDFYKYIFKHMYLTMWEDKALLDYFIEHSKLPKKGENYGDR